MPLQKRFPLVTARREVLHESCYFDHLHKSLRFLVAQPEDLNVLGCYMGEIFDDFWYQHISRPLSQLLQQKMTILATDFFEVCGIAIGNVINGNGNLKGLGIENSKVLFLELVQVYPEYEKDGLIERQLILESFKRAKDAKIRYVLYNSRKSMKVAKKLGMNKVNNLPIQIDQNYDDLMFVDLKTIEDLLNVEPQLPDAYKIKPAKRRCLKRFTPKLLNRELLVEVALPEDEAVFRHYMFNEFMQQTPVNKTLQLSEAESIEHFNVRMSSDQFSRGFCLMVTDQGRICAAGTCKVIYEPIGNRKKQEVKIPMDLAEESDKIPFSTQRSRQAKAIDIWMTGFVAQFLPEDCDKYIRAEMRTVHPYYTRCGIAGAITEATDQIILENGFEYFQTLFLAHAMARKVEGKEAYPPAKFRFPYAQFQYKGQQIIKDGITCDGGQHVTINLGPVRRKLNSSEFDDLQPRAKY